MDPAGLILVSAGGGQEGSRRENSTGSEQHMKNKKREREDRVMEGLGHLLLFAFLFWFSTFMVAPVMTDVTMAALCPGRDECSLAIYLTGLQQAVTYISSL
jgi:hypothetical protein